MAWTLLFGSAVFAATDPEKIETLESTPDKDEQETGETSPESNESESASGGISIPREIVLGIFGAAAVGGGLAGYWFSRRKSGGDK